MFALSPGYSILRGIMHSLSLSAVLEKKIHTGRKKYNRPLSSQHPLRISSAQILPLPLRVYLSSFTLDTYDTINSTGCLYCVMGGELQQIVKGPTHKKRTVLGIETNQYTFYSQNVFANDSQS